MGIIGNIQGTAMQKAIKMGTSSFERQAEKIVELQKEIVEKLTWVMQVQQKIADRFEIKLVDPLED